MELALIITGSCLLYAAGLGFTIRFCDRNLNWDDEFIWLGSIFLWPCLLVGGLCWVGHKKVEEFFEHRKTLLKRKREIELLPPIYIKDGAKIKEFDQYKLLKRLCSDFEIENGFDNLL